MRSALKHRDSRPPWLAVTLLCLWCASPQAHAQAPANSSQSQFGNFQHLVCNYSTESGELSLALLSTSTQTDPKRVPDLKNKIAIKLEIDAERSEVVPAEELKVAVLGDYRAKADRKYRLFAFDLVIDESNSIETPDLLKARSVIEGFLRRIPVVYEAQIVRFTDQVATPGVFTNDVEELRRALGPGESRLRGGTSFYAALERAVRELSANEQPLRFIVAFTDGADTSNRSFNEFKRSLQQTIQHEQIFLFIAGIGTEGGIKHDELRQLPGSMGVYFQLDQVPDVDQVFDQVAQILDKTYIVRIPVLSSHRGAKKVYVLRDRGYQGSHKTLQDIVLPARCVPR